MIIDLIMFLGLIITILRCQTRHLKLLRDLVGPAARSNAFPSTRSQHLVLAAIISLLKERKDTNSQQDASLKLMLS